MRIVNVHDENNVYLQKTHRHIRVIELNSVKCVLESFCPRYQKDTIDTEFDDKKNLITLTSSGNTEEDTENG